MLANEPSGGFPISPACNLRQKPLVPLKMEIVQKGNQYIVPCREWAAVHLGRDIKYSYKSKRNAERCVNDPKRNMVTGLCGYTQKLFTRVCVLETILLGIKQQTEHYDFGDADSVISDGGGSDELDKGAAGDDTGTGGGTEGATGSTASTN